MRLLGTCILVLGSLSVSAARADTLFLRTGKTLKIDVLSCDEKTCVANLPGGEVEVRPFDILRVEPDEEVDSEPATMTAHGTEGPALSRARSIEGMVAEAARRYSLPRSLVRAVAQAESALDPNARSPKGAQGVMQLMPGTARDLGVRNTLDPGENIDAGARLLRQLLEKYQGRVAEALAAYNAGAAAVAKYNGVPPYRETRGYIRKVVKDFEKGETKGAAAPEKKK
jgi:hypothetical protein